MTKTTLRTSTVATPVDQSLMIDFHVDVVEADAVESFWFEDEADMIDRVRRKLGVERSEGLAAVIRGFPKAHAQAAEDPRDHTALIVAATEEELRELVIAAQKA